MSVFRILYLGGGVLEGWEEVEADNVVDALQARRAERLCERIEVWTEGKRTAVLRTTRDSPLPKSPKRKAGKKPSPHIPTRQARRP